MGLWAEMNNPCEHTPYCVYCQKRIYFFEPMEIIGKGWDVHAECKLFKEKSKMNKGNQQNG
jgi:hypothetical protein